MQMAEFPVEPMLSKTVGARPPPPVRPKRLQPRPLLSGAVTVSSPMWARLGGRAAAGVGPVWMQRGDGHDCRHVVRAGPWPPSPGTSQRTLASHVLGRFRCTALAGFRPVFRTFTLCPPRCARKRKKCTSSLPSRRATISRSLTVGGDDEARARTPAIAAGCSTALQRNARAASALREQSFKATPKPRTR